MKDEDGNSDKHMYIKESGIVHRKIYIYIYIYIGRGKHHKNKKTLCGEVHE